MHVGIASGLTEAPKEIALSADWSARDAQSRLSAVIDAAQAEPQIVTKRGKPVALVVSVAEFEQLRRLSGAKPRSFADMLLAVPRADAEIGPASVVPRDVEF